MVRPHCEGCSCRAAIREEPVVKVRALEDTELVLVDAA